MKKADLQDVLNLVKEKLSRDSEAACGLFWSDNAPTTRYSINEEDVTTLYGINEEDVAVKTEPPLKSL